MKRKFTITFLLVCSVFFTFSMSNAEAVTYYVPDDFSAIQAAVDAAINGDTILVRPGRYYENVRVISKGIALKSTDGPEVTVIDRGGLSNTLYYSGYYEHNSLDGFTVTNGKASYGGGIYVYIKLP